MELDRIIRRCKRGKLDAKKLLYDQYADTLYYIALRYLNNTTEAEDLLHDVFIIIFDKIGSFKGEGSFEGWMKRIMVNASLSYLKKRKKHIDVDSEQAQWGEDHEEDNIVSMDKVLRTLNKLPSGARTVFNLYYVEGYSHQKIANELDISIGTSKSQLNRAKELLRDELIKEGENYVL